MQLLVTGGAGFIGSNFVRHILQSQPDFKVLNVDKLTYAGNLENLADVQDEPRYRFVKADISKPEEMAPCFSNKVDVVVNFAAESHVDRSILDSSEFLQTNVVGTQVLLDLARQNRVKRFVQVSTDEVYGALGETGSFTEETPLAPNSPYSASKAAADLFVRAAHQTHGFDTLITRCSNNYGSHQFPEKLIPLMVLNAIEEKPLPVYGDGLYTRDWIHVRDHCRALETVLLRGSAGEIYNIGGRQELQNLQVVREILKLCGKTESLIEHVQDRPGHDRRYAVCIDKIERELGWSPAIGFERGLRETVKWYADNRDWVEQVRSGGYRRYYRQMYEQRKETLSNL